MPSETFRDRFKRLVEPLSDTELAVVLGVSADAARKMRRGDIKSLKFENGLRLCERLGIDPFYLQFGKERQTRFSALRSLREVEEPVQFDAPIGAPAELTLTLFDATFRALQALADRQDLQIDLPSLDEIRHRLAGDDARG